MLLSMQAALSLMYGVQLFRPICLCHSTIDGEKVPVDLEGNVFSLARMEQSLRLRTYWLAFAMPKSTHFLTVVDTNVLPVGISAVSCLPAGYRFSQSPSLSTNSCQAAASIHSHLSNHFRRAGFLSCVSLSFAPGSTY